MFIAAQQPYNHENNAKYTRIVFKQEVPSFPYLE